MRQRPRPGNGMQIAQADQPVTSAQDKDVPEQMPVHQDARDRRHQHGETENAREDQPPRIRQVQPHMQLDVKAPERRERIVGREFVAKTFGARDDPALRPDRGEDSALAPRTIDGLVGVEERPHIAGRRRPQGEVLAELSGRFRLQPREHGIERLAQRLARSEQPARPGLDFVREHGGRAGYDDGIQQQAQQCAGPTVDRHQRPGFARFQVNHGFSAGSKDRLSRTE